MAAIVSDNVILVFLLQFFGYVFFNWFLQLWFYRWRGDDLWWKVQPKKRVGNLGASGRGGCCWWPLCARSGAVEGRMGDHALLATINLTIASSFAALTMMGQEQRWVAMRGGELGWEDAGGVVGWVLVDIVFESVVEYWWHRAMHLTFCFKTCHRIHHAYHSPIPFDDMYIHPLEATGYYCILFSPAWLFPQHWSSFLGYLVLLGLAGVLDHSGTHVRLPGPLAVLYDAADHDVHHSDVDVNFGFPNMIIDRIMGTYMEPPRKEEKEKGE